MFFDITGKDEYLMLDSKIIYRYIHAGNSFVTLVNPDAKDTTKCKAHQYAFCKPKDSREFPEGTIFAYVIHDGHRMYLGMLDGSGFRRTAKSRFDEDTEAVKGVRYIIRMSNEQDLVDKKLMHLYHSGNCCYCGRKLTSSKAMKLGIGKKCLQKYNINLQKVPWDGNS